MAKWRQSKQNSARPCLLSFDLSLLLSTFSLREILNGIAVTDENGNKLGHSKVSTGRSFSRCFIVFSFTFLKMQMLVDCNIFKQFFKSTFHLSISYRYKGKAKLYLYILPPLQKAAAKGITQVVISRVTMAAPGMSTCQKSQGGARELRPFYIQILCYM